MMRRKSKVYVFFLLLIGTSINVARLTLIISKIVLIHDRDIVKSVIAVLESLRSDDHSLKGWIYLPSITSNDWILYATFTFLIVWSLVSTMGLIGIIGDYVYIITITAVFYTLGVIGEAINVITTPLHEPVLFFPFMVNMITAEILLAYLCFLTNPRMKNLIGNDGNDQSPSQIANQSTDSKGNFHETPL